MGLPSNQGNIFYRARPVKTTEKKRETARVCGRDRKREGEEEKFGGGGLTSASRLGVGWCLRCYVWLIWAHLFFPFSLTPLSFFLSLISLSLFIVPSLALSRSLTLSSFLTFFLFLSSVAPVPPLFKSFLHPSPSSFPFLLLSSHVSVYMQECACHLDFSTVTYLSICSNL